MWLSGYFIGPTLVLGAIWVWDPYSANRFYTCIGLQQNNFKKQGNKKGFVNTFAAKVRYIRTRKSALNQ